MGRKSRAVEDYFHSIDTPMKAHILGLLAADGNVYVNKGRAEYKIGIKLHHQERRPRQLIACQTQVDSAFHVSTYQGCGNIIMRVLM